MAPTASNTFNLRSILEKEKLSGTNFIDWYRNLRIVLKQEKKEYVLELPYPDDLPENATATQKREYEKHTNDAVDVSCLMLATMSSELQKQYENADAHNMIEVLRGMFENQARSERYNISKSLFACRLAENGSVSPHVIKMIGYIENLEKLGAALHPDLATDVILQSLPASYEPFILNFQMNSLEKTLAELHGMLKTAEASIKKSGPSQVNLVQKDSKKRKRKTKAKATDQISSTKPKPAAAPKPKPAGSDPCFHCKKPGHWKRNCKLYLEELKKKGGDTSSSDVAYALSAVSRYQSNPGEAHWGANKNILKYLRRTMGMFLVYGGEEELVVNGYTDASFQTDKDDSRSQSGYVFCLNGGAVSWKSSKQDTVADSTTEAEYLAASEAAKEAVWIRKFVSELGVVPSASSPMNLYCDNSGAIAQAKEPRAHQKNKHVLRRYHLIRDIVARGDVKICKVHTDSNIADPLTKPLSQPKHEAHMRYMGIRYLHD
ncbi:hypothetical protein QOZ80_UnG0720430 [Eleusine coracana subsp. coracana]|uniref:CCHC-type domain-containing protein n=1 Tax=Eleusine coracana subsp. coracana TaxID=191504 RepID=A0AAV9FZH1_ELECO|nr:hypothetical protein QOZ80_UnG0720430 [Eleusine coracana subsp. coracana]